MPVFALRYSLKTSTPLHQSTKSLARSLHFEQLEDRTLLSGELLNLYSISGDPPAASLVNGEAAGVSLNGSVIVGTLYSDSSDVVEAFRWTPETGVIGLGDYFGSADILSYANAVSADGKVIVGEGWVNELRGPLFMDEAFRWTEETGAVGLGDLPGGFVGSNAYDVSADGSVIVGQSFVTNGIEAFRWTQETGMVGLGQFADGLASVATGVSADGSVVVGNVEVGVGQNRGFHWTQQTGMQIIGDDDSSVFVDAVSGDGSVAVGRWTTSNGTQAFRWTQETGMVGLGVLTGDFSSSANGVSSDGSVIVGESADHNGWSEAFRWTAVGGMEGLGYLPESSAYSYASDVSPSGCVVVGAAASWGYQSAPFYTIADTDGDSLCDHWEINGIDINGDGIIDLDLPGMGADPMHKDIFVEVDAMAGRAPAQATLDRVVKAFANAPVENPDENYGINLHIQYDQKNLPLNDWSDPSADFQLVKSNNFGTENERNHANSASILEAKRKVFRYGVFGDKVISKNLLGLGEFHGDDFFVTLGSMPRPGGTPDQQAGTFMHELGHTLGLDHGGGDSDNYKPNYHSVMNYLWTVPKKTYAKSWVLDYSREKFDDLDERSLNEAHGIGTFNHLGHMVLVGPPGRQLVPEFGSVDWNDDGDIYDTNVIEDINWIIRDGKQLFPEYTVLKGFEDWSNLKYSPYGAGYFSMALDLASTIEEEFTIEIYEALNNIILAGPAIAVEDNSLFTLDSSVEFTTPLSQYRNGLQDSPLIRPAQADTQHFFDVTNVGDEALTLFEIQINAPGVTVDLPLSPDSADDIVLAPGETQRFHLTFAPPTSGITGSGYELVILSDALSHPSFNLTLKAQSTFNSDVNYDGIVNFGELGFLNETFGSQAGDPDWDPTADFNGDGIINFGDLGLLNTEFGLSIFEPAPLSLVAEETSSSSATLQATRSIDGPTYAFLATADTTDSLFDNSESQVTAEEAAKRVAVASIDTSEPENYQELDSNHDRFYEELGGGMSIEGTDENSFEETDLFEDESWDVLLAVLIDVA